MRFLQPRRALQHLMLAWSPLPLAPLAAGCSSLWLCSCLCFAARRRRCLWASTTSSTCLSLTCTTPPFLPSMAQSSWPNTMCVLCFCVLVCTCVCVFFVFVFVSVLVCAFVSVWVCVCETNPFSVALSGAIQQGMQLWCFSLRPGASSLLRECLRKVRVRVRVCVFVCAVAMGAHPWVACSSRGVAAAGSARVPGAPAPCRARKCP